MLDYDNMGGPSLQVVGTRFLNSLLIKLSRDFNFMECRYYRTFKGSYFPIAWG